MRASALAIRRSSTAMRLRMSPRASASNQRPRVLTGPLASALARDAADARAAVTLRGRWHQASAGAVSPPVFASRPAGGAASLALEGRDAMSPVARSGGGTETGAEVAEHAGIDTVGLADHAHRAGEVARLARVDPAETHPGRLERHAQAVIVAPARLEDQRPRVLTGPLASALARDAADARAAVVLRGRREETLQAPSLAQVAAMAFSADGAVSMRRAPRWRWCMSSQSLATSTPT